MITGQTVSVESHGLMGKHMLSTHSGMQKTSGIQLGNTQQPTTLLYRSITSGFGSLTAQKSKQTFCKCD